MVAKRKNVSYICECGDDKRDHEDYKGACRLCRAFGNGTDFKPCKKYRHSHTEVKPDDSRKW